MHRMSPVALVGVVVLCLALLAAGCAGRAGPPGAAAPSAPSGSTPSPAPPWPPPAQPPASTGTPPAGRPAPASLPDAKVTPLSPGVGASAPVAVRDLQVRALVQYQTTFQPGSATLELNGQPLKVRIIKEKAEMGPGERRLIVAATATGLADGPYVAQVRVGGSDGRKAGAEWRFTVTAAGAGGGTAGGTAGSKTLTLYFADRPLVVVGAAGEFGLVTPVRRAVPATTAPARSAIEQLILGPVPAGGEVDRTMPATSRLKGLTIRDGVARVDFSAEFARDSAGGTTGGAITVQSIIYTLTEFPTVKSVQVLVEGEPWSDGHFVWDTPWSRPAPAVDVVTLPPCP